MESCSVKPLKRLPTKKECIKSLGDISKLPKRLQICFEEEDIDQQFIRKKPFSGPDCDTYEWIYRHDTPQQTLAEYHADGPNKVYSNQCKVYLKPQDEKIPEYFLTCCFKYAKAFFHGMHVQLLPCGDWKNLDIKVYEKSYGIQLDSSDIMEKTFYKKPKDTYTYMNIVRDDLSRKGFGYVIGVSNFKSNTGVFSTARYDPEWRKCLSPGDDDEEDEKEEEISYESLVHKQNQFNRLLFRSLKVLAHEITHTFCMPHCPYYECLMNGSNTIIEGKRKPMYLCPVCLRKMQSVIGFDIIERYQKIVEVIEELENPFFEDTLAWYKERLEQVENRAFKEGAYKPYRIVHPEVPLPMKKVVRTVVKKKKPARPGLMPKEEVKKSNTKGKKLTAIQRLIMEKKNKK
ncbi:unnamed protein product [Moneuplotes crassus]|uniref:Archaemetzincin-2 n=1 Tax=Euplotes crassus TaxID=5936 RepID=A0AAD1UN00_EUPCR|nr:unnamed protein product [Moneuplotes crassus]